MSSLVRMRKAEVTFLSLYFLVPITFTFGDLSHEYVRQTDEFGSGKMKNKPRLKCTGVSV